MKDNLKGTFTLFKVMLRQDQKKLLIWLASLIAITLMTAVLYPSVYQDQDDLIAFAYTMQNPVMKVMLGGGYPPEVYNTALTFAHEMFLFTIIAVAIMNIMFSTKLMRNDEEEGRVELIKSLPVGRYSYFLAGSLIILAMNLILILGVGLGLTILSPQGMTFSGSMLYGVTLGVMGLVFASITTFISQIFSSGRTAMSISLVMLIFFYIIRGLGDASVSFFLYLSPLGMTSKILVFYENNWWPIFILLGIVIIFSYLASYLYRIRDMGSGLVSPRKGKDQASKLDKTVFGFILRLERTNIIAWAVGIFFFAFSFGAIIKDFEDYFKDMELILQFLGDNAEENFITSVINFLMKVCSVFAIVPCLMILMRLSKEEARGRIEHLYTRKVNRINFMVSHIIMAILVAFIMQMALVLGLYSAGYETLKPVMTFTELLTLGLVYLPSIFIVIGLTIILIGYLPRKLNFIWGYFSFVFMEFYLNGILKIPSFISKLSVFDYIPSIPDEKVNFLWVILLTIIAGILFIIGLLQYKKRDIYSY